MSEAKQKGPPTPPPPPTKTLFYMAALAGVLVLVQLALGTAPGDAIRYDEFKRYVRDGRVDWVELGKDDIRGGYLPNQKPPPREAAKGEAQAPRPDQFVTGRIEDDTLIALLEKQGVAFRAEPTSIWSENGAFLFQMGLMLLLFVMLFGGLFRRLGESGGGALAFAKSRGKLFQPTEVSVGFADVAGVDEAKEELEEIIQFLRHPERYTALGAKIPKGVLLVGPPGTGKTLLARAVAGEARVPFISINGSEFVELFVGVGAARVRDLFQQAEQAAPCIVFIDELDAIGKSRGGPGSGPGGHEEREQTLNQLLVEMDGFEPKQAVILMSATNRPEVLDPALLRPGRFDRQVLVDRPDRAGREQILRVHVRRVPLGNDVDLDALAARTPGFAGADLANLVNEAALLAARRGAPSVSMEDFSSAIDRVVAGLERKSRLITEPERRRVAFHEAGHALASVLAGSHEFVHKISIIPRGAAALGYTMQMPSRDRYLLTQQELDIKLVGLLGGRAAEELVFGDASTGAANDLLSATELARSMVTEYGMSDAVGRMAVASAKSRFLGGGLESAMLGTAVGDSLRDSVDGEVRRLLEQAHERAFQLLASHREALDGLASKLLEHEQLEGEPLRKLLLDATGDGASSVQVNPHSASEVG